MIYINKEKFSNINLYTDNFYVVMDFDRTITTSNSPGSWNILENPAFISPNLKKESSALVEKYFPIELDYSLDSKTKTMYMQEWYSKNMNLLYKYNLTYSKLLDCVKNSNVVFRNGYKDFFEFLYKNNIPLIILSAGIGNVIVELFKLNNCLFDNMHIISNFIKFDNDIMLPFTDDMIHTCNKNIHNVPKVFSSELKNKNYILLFGDLIEDLNMVPKSSLDKTISFGFLEKNIDENFDLYKKLFDVVLTDNTSFFDILSFLKNEVI